MAKRFDDIELMLDGNGGSGGSDYGIVIGGGNSFAMSNPSAPSQLVGENKPTTKFDISVLSGLSPKQKYRGNLVKDIQEVYQTYITGSPVGRGGTYALDNIRRFGVTLTEGARRYLSGIGLPIIPEVVTNTGNGTGGGTGGGGDTTEQIKKVQDTLQKQIEDLKKNFDSNDTVKVLSDTIKQLFGNAVYNPPLQSQATGYTPVTTSQPLGGAVSGGSNITTFIILGVIGIIAYFVYKRFAS